MKTLAMLIPLSSLAVAQNSYESISNIVHAEATAEPTFQFERRWGRNEELYMFHEVASRRSDRSRLAAVAYKMPDQDGAKWQWVAMMPNLATHQPNLAFSDLPLGTKVRRMGGPGGGWELQVMDGPVLVSTSLAYAASSPPENVVADDKIVCEGITRRILARCRGLQAQSAQNININGTPVGSVTGPRGERLVDLGGYCEARGLELTTNQQLGTASFTQGGELVIIPLAALKIKDGPRWIETRDISLIKNGRWYVSYDGLESTR